MNGRTITRAAQNVDQILKYAEEKYGKEKQAEIKKSYKNGKVFSVLYFVVVIALLILSIILISGGNGKTMAIGNVDENYYMNSYARGSHVELDLSDYSAAINPGSRYVAYLNQSGAVSDVISYEQYKADQRADGLMYFAILAGGLVIAFALYYFLFSKLFSKKWFDFTSEYKQDIALRKYSERVIAEMGKCRKIRGGFDYATFCFEEDYIIKVYGELMPGATFNVYKSSIKKWEEPHGNDVITPQIRDAIIAEVLKKEDSNTVKIKFL